MRKYTIEGKVWDKVKKIWNLDYWVSGLNGVVDEQKIFQDGGSQHFKIDLSFLLMELEQK